MSFIYITLLNGEIQNCYGDAQVEVRVVDLDVQSERDLANNEEMLRLLDGGELLDLTPYN